MGNREQRENKYFFFLNFEQWYPHWCRLTGKLSIPKFRSLLLTFWGWPIFTNFFKFQGQIVCTFFTPTNPSKQQCTGVLKGLVEILYKIIELFKKFFFIWISTNFFIRMSYQVTVNYKIQNREAAGKKLKNRPAFCDTFGKIISGFILVLWCK